MQADLPTDTVKRVAQTESSTNYLQTGGRPLGALHYHVCGPMHAFPKVASKMIEELIQNLQTPIAVNIGVTLAAMSAACQPWIRVQLPNEDTPQITALATIVGVDSVMGDNRAANHAFRSIREYSLDQAHQYAKSETTRETQSALYRAKHKALSGKLTKLYDPDKNPSAKDIAEAEDALGRHISGRVKAAEPRLYIKGNITVTRLVKDLEGIHVPALWATDGSQGLFGKITKEDMAIINEILEGRTVLYQRLRQNALVENALLTIFASTSCGEFDLFIKNKGRFAMDDGLIPRCLMAKTSGNARIQPIMEPESPCSDAFNQRVTELLSRVQQLTASGELEPITLEFTDEAKLAFMGLLDDCRHRVNSTNDWRQIEKSAKKYPSNVARIAAIFHFFGGQDGNLISIDTLRRARIVADWYMEQAKQILVIEPTKRRLEKLIDFLYADCIQKRRHERCVSPFEGHLISVRWILQNHNVDKDTLASMLTILYREDMAWPGASSSGAQCIELNYQKFSRQRVVSDFNL